MSILKILFTSAALLCYFTAYAALLDCSSDQNETLSKNFHNQKVAELNAYCEESPQISAFIYEKSSMYTNDFKLRKSTNSCSVFRRQNNSVFICGLLDDSHDGDVEKKSKLNTTNQTTDSDLFSFVASIKGQSSSKQLDPSGKKEISEIYAPTYFPGSLFLADQDFILNLEARIKLPKFIEYQTYRMELILFVDTRAITMNQYAFADGLNHTTISGAGVGLKWTFKDEFEAKIYFANQLENQVLAIAPDLSHLFWIQAVKYF